MQYLALLPQIHSPSIVGLYTVPPSGLENVLVDRINMCQKGFEINVVIIVSYISFVAKQGGGHYNGEIEIICSLCASFKGFGET